MNQKNLELEIIKKTDFITDSSHELPLKAEKVLSFLLKELKVSNGVIVFHDPFQNFLNVLATKGKINNRVVSKAFNEKEVVETENEIAIPISIRNKIFGVVYLAGKKFSNQELELIRSAEVVLDGTFSEELRSTGLQSLFEKYVDSKVINKMIEHPDSQHMSGERHNCSILFADLNGFTKYSNSHAPETTIKLLDLFYSRMSEIVLNHHGTVDKFIGDEIMAVFGSPLPQKDHAEIAIKSAVEMQKSAKYIVEKFNIPNSGLSVGIATGLVIAGDVGSEKMKDYTVIGSKVNLAARLTGAAPRNSIIVDEETKDHAASFEYIDAELEKIKGFSGDTQTYKVMARI